MVKNVKQKDLRQMFPAKVSKLKKSQDVETDIKVSLNVVDGIPSSSTDIVAEAQEGPASKRLKTENYNGDSNKNLKKKSLASKPLKCDVCKQLLDSESLKMFGGDDADAVEEFIALASESLSLFDADSNGDSEWNEKPQHRITDFTVYDEYGHLCPFDTGLIDQNVHLYFSGYVKPIYDDSPSLQGGVRGSRLGPIDSWYIAGFDGGEKELIGFTTAYADYLLSQPSEQYALLFDMLREKTYLSKTVIEILEEDSDMTMEDLINCVQLVVPPENCAKFSEETLLKHAQFLIEQIESYDRAADDDEDLLITVPAVRGLIQLAGVTLGGTQPANSHRALVNVQPKVASKTKSTDISHATVTPLVQSSFEAIFVDQMQATSRQTRCNECEVCKMPDCGECNMCKDKIKFGGSGKKRQACMERKCPNIAVMRAEENSEDKTDNLDPSNKVAQLKADKKVSSSIEGKFTGNIICKEGKKVFYKSAVVENEALSLGDYVSIAPETPDIPSYIGRITTMFTKGGENLLHVHWLNRAGDTVLGEAHDERELFLSDSCDDAPLGSVLTKVTVNYCPPPPNWNMIGGMPVPEKKDTALFFKLWYDSDKARFECPLREYLEWEEEEGCCPACTRRRERERAAIPFLEKEKGVLKYKNIEYNVGDYVYVRSDAYSMPSRGKSNITKIRKDKVDDEMFPEYYRKTDYIKGNNDLVPEVFRIGRVVSFSTKQEGLDGSSVKVTVKKMYRAENLVGNHGNIENFCSEAADINLLFYSIDQVKIRAEKILGKCTVRHREVIEDLGRYTTLPDHFYFSECWDSDTKSLEDIPSEARCSNKGKKKRVDLERKEPSFRKLRTLDVFAGCGGLSEGFHQAGVAESCWAIEFFSEAAQAYKLNNPKAEVFNEDCNAVLKMAIDGVPTNKLGQQIPQKGEVELLCGGPPCQGFSGMNRFNAREYSMFKNSLISSYLSYCEFYRPRYFLLENVRNFVSYKKNMVLKLCLSSLVNMGYQCTFGVLQAGCYGVAQTRRRAFVLAAAPGEVLPQFPEPRFSDISFLMTVSVEAMRAGHWLILTSCNLAPTDVLGIDDKTRRQ
ncbi:DNA (cytosine-5)-methyltransferase 1-like [Bolinopsis microptera]|uniref:DNA (cytosine-5)-methyltransferase 1-like n=1 Tax=Bolinopsis microptera TaxID=2820187 RepID=UPI00307A1465